MIKKVTRTSKDKGGARKEIECVVSAGDPSDEFIPPYPDGWEKIS